MNIYTELLSHLFQIRDGNTLVNSGDIKEYELIKEKKSKLSANERKKIVYRVEKYLKRLEETYMEKIK